MGTENRREFLLTLAKGVVYSAPVVTSLAAPVALLGQGQGVSKKCGADPHNCFQAPPSEGNPRQNRPDPWQAPPPGQQPPPGGQPPPGR